MIHRHIALPAGSTFSGQQQPLTAPTLPPEYDASRDPNVNFHELLLLRCNGLLCRIFPGSFKLPVAQEVDDLARYLF